ncbi:MAG: molybdenum cofactor guanylyltransferase [Opitutae bacterium]|nr:molybdenum cofactor guanylyltransferase [Opitutae bacterium]
MKRQLTGVVIAGGRSTRMGRDKARLCVDGVELWRRQQRVLTAAGARPVIFALRAGQRSFAPGLTVVRDTREGVGPIAGVHAALRACETEWLAVLAVDLPRVDAAWFEKLAGLCRPGRGAVGVSREGFFEPFAAIYPLAALLSFEEHVANGGSHSLQPLLRELVDEGLMKAVKLTAREQATLFNWNAGALPE